jgi:hypothetical protein
MVDRLPVRYAALIMSVWEIIFISFIAFYGNTIGAIKTYGDYLEYPQGMIVWVVIVAIFGGVIPFCFTKCFND